MKNPKFATTLKIFAWLLALVAATADPACANADISALQPNCFDVEVFATIERQYPRLTPEIGRELVVSMRPPWVLELNVKRVIKGRLNPIPLTVLSLQRVPPGLEPSDWRLRRNSQASFNLASPLAAAQCPDGTPPAPGLR